MRDDLPGRHLGRRHLDPKHQAGDWHHDRGSGTTARQRTADIPDHEIDLRPLGRTHRPGHGGLSARPGATEGQPMTTTTGVATFGDLLRQVAPAADAGLPALSVDVSPRDYDRTVTIHVYVGYDDPDQEREAATSWLRWWTARGVVDWSAQTEGQHRWLRGDWYGWQVVLVWLGQVPAADMLTDAAVPA